MPASVTRIFLSLLLGITDWTIFVTGSAKSGPEACPGQCRCNIVPIERSKADHSYWASTGGEKYDIMNDPSYHQNKHISNQSAFEAHPNKEVVGPFSHHYPSHAIQHQHHGQPPNTRTLHKRHNQHNQKQSHRYPYSLRRTLTSPHDTKRSVHRPKKFRAGLDQRHHWWRTYSLRQLSQYKTDVNIYNETRSRVHTAFDIRHEQGTDLMCVGMKHLPTSLPSDAIRLSVYGESKRQPYDTAYQHPPAMAALSRGQQYTYQQFVGTKEDNPPYLTDIDKIAFKKSPQLQEVALVGNRLQYISPHVFQDLRELSSLNMRKNNIEYLSTAALHGLHKLQEIRFSDNRLAHLHENFFRQNTKLKRVYLDTNRLNRLYEGLFEPLPFLEVLDLSRNILTDMPANIFEKNHLLHTLLLDENHFRVLRPEWFRNLKNLKVLSIRQNRLLRIPNNLIRKSNFLAELDLSHNLVANVDKEFFQNLAYIHKIDLSSNKISTLPYHCFVHQQQLRSLNLADNLLTSLESKPFYKLATIEKLNLSNNRLKTIPVDTFTLMASLMKLDLSVNRLEMIPKDTFLGLSRLRELNLANNSINELQDGSFNMATSIHHSQLTWLSIQHNHITELTAKTLYGMPHLKFLNIGYNRITIAHKKSFNTLPYLHTLLMNNNELTSLAIGQFRSQKVLTHLDLSHNRLLTLVKGIFAGLANLEKVNLADNRITRIGLSTFQDTPKLIRFELRGNDLRFFNFDVLAPMRRLHYVDLANNQISSLKETQRKDIFIVYLSLAGNNLKSLEKKVMRVLVPGASVILSNNPLMCDCKLRWAREYAGGNQLRLGDPDLIRCKEPLNLTGLKMLSLSHAEFRCLPTPYHSIESSRNNYRKENIDSSKTVQCTSPAREQKFNSRQLRKDKQELYRFHATIIDSFGQVVCNGHLITSEWVLTTATCIQSLMTTSSDNTGTFPVRTQVRIGQGQTEKIDEVVVQPNDGQLALLKLSGSGNSAAKGGRRDTTLEACIMGEKEFPDSEHSVRRGAFTARIDGYKSKSKLRSISGKYSPALCARRQHKLCVRMRQRKRPNKELFTLGSPFYLGSSRNWRLAGIGSGFMSTSNIDGPDNSEPSLNIVEFYPLWASVNWIDRTVFG